MTHGVQDLGDGVRQFQTGLWQTNSVLVDAGDAVFVCDAAFTEDEIARIHADAEARPTDAQYFLLTHADFDHTCGVAAFTRAKVVAGQETADKVTSGAVAEELRANAAEWGVEWKTDALRVDLVVEPEAEVDCGGVALVAVDAPSHGREGIAFLLPDQGLLLAGDHLSAITYPLLAASPPRALAATERLADALDRDPVRRVVPGHGPSLSREQAQRIAEDDRGYLEALEAAAREAVESELPPGHALLHVFAVEPPRPTTPDFDVYNIRASNARQVLDDVRDRSGAAT
jgi:glyoxylase-like metal-dependent hydrolase (beta-lactamase superfamily II)